MNTATALGVGYASAVVALLTAIWRVGPKRRRLSEAERVAAARKRVGLPAPDEYDGPDSLRLLQETDAYLDAVVLADEALLKRFRPDSATGLNKLRQAIRDEQQNGDQK